MLKVRTLLAVAAAAFTLSTPAMAQTYIGVSGGASKTAKSKNRGTFTTTVPATAAFPAINSGTEIGWDTKFKTGYNFGLQVGHRMASGLRVEAAFDYNRNRVKTHRNLTVGGTNIDALDSAVLTRGTASATNPPVGTVLNSPVGKQSSYGMFVNGYYDFNPGGSFQPYVGAGVGIQKLKFDYRPSNVDVGQGKDTNFAWQLAAGATAKIGTGLELFGQYNYRDSGKTKMALDLLPVALTAKGKQSIFSAGIRIPFGGGAEK